MKWLLILVLCDKWDIPTESMTVYSVKDKAACETAAKIVMKKQDFIKAICVPRDGDESK